MNLSVTGSAVVGHLDILGFRNFVRADGDRHDIARRLNNAIERALEWFGGRDALRGTPDSEWSIHIFSDCLCAAKPATDIGILVALDAIASFDREMIASGFPIRGGLAIGPHSESDLLIFSQAQIQAYDLESKEARFPRVVLSPQLLERIESIEDDDMRQTIKEYVVVDEDSLPFINYLVFEEEGVWSGGHDFYLYQKRVLQQGLQSQNINEDVMSKFLWMARFHNWSLFHTAHILKQSGALDEDTVWSFSSLTIPDITTKSKFRSLLWSDRSFEQPLVQMDQHEIDWIKEWPRVHTEDDEPENGV